MGIPIQGTARGSPGAAYETAKRRGAQRLAFLRDYLVELYRVCGELTVDADVLVAQADLETGAFTSRYYVDDGNVAGFGAFDDGTDLGLTYGALQAARGHAAHVCAYLGKTDIPQAYIDADPRWDAVARAGYVGSVTTTDDLGNGRWATDRIYATKLLNRYRAYWGEPPASVPKESPMAAPHIIVLSGHRSTGEVGTGAPGEREITDDMARAAVDELRRRGYEAAWWQRDLDNDSLPDQTQGNLTTVINGVRAHLAAWRKANPDRLAVLLDFNFNGAESPQHVLVADAAGLRSAYADGNVAADTMANNPLDVQLGSAIARAIVAQIPGTTLYGGSGSPRTPGVMSERTSGVGGTGWRLGVFGGTAIYRDWLVRLILETGGTNDFRRYPNFAARVASAVADAIGDVMGEAGAPATGGPPPVTEATTYVRAVKEILVRAAPDVTARVGFALAPGEVAAVIDPTPRAGSGLAWLDVRMEGRGTGFVPVGDVEPASAPEPAPAPEPAGTTFRTRYKLPLRTEPGFAGAIVGELAEGTAGEILEGPREVDKINWYRARLADGEGWVPASIVRTLEIDAPNP